MDNAWEETKRTIFLSFHMTLEMQHELCIFHTSDPCSLLLNSFVSQNSIGNSTQLDRMLPMAYVPIFSNSFRSPMLEKKLSITMQCPPPSLLPSPS